MSTWDREMERALELDGEKLRQLTGEDHGPWDVEYVMQVPCPCCFESCGYLGDHSRDYDGADCFTPNPFRPCPECNGTGAVDAEPITLADLEAGCGE